MNTAEIRLYEMLKAKIGEKEAEAFVELTEKTVDQRFNGVISELASKKDLADLRAEMSKRIYQVSVGQLLTIIITVVSLILLLRK
jgi:hypothetical protein